MSGFLSFSGVIVYIGYILVAILVLLLMVTIHEFGHYVAGKMLKFKINEFSVGFGPKLLQKKKKNGELLSLRALPLGGYCAFEGENDEGADLPNSFNKQKPWKRIIVLFFGAFFNFLSAIIFSFIVLLCSGYELVEIKNINNSSMNYGCFETGDVIYGVEGTKFDFVVDDYFSSLIDDSLKDKYETYFGENLTDEYHYYEKIDNKNEDRYMAPRTLTFNVKRDGKQQEVEAFVNVVYNSKGKLVGWSLLNTEKETTELELTTYKYSFGEAVLQSIPFTCRWSFKVLKIFGQLITGQLSIKTLGGPVTTIKTIANYTQESFSTLLLLLPVIATNLAVFNLLPIPALDGFQIVFVIIEWIRKKPVKREVINAINNIGLYVLLGFVVVVDVLQFIL